MKPLIAAIGTFDGIHRGHAFLLSKLISTAESTGHTPAVVTFSRHPLEVIRPDRVPATITAPETKLQLLRDAGIEKIITLDFNDDLRQLTAAKFMDLLRTDYGIDALLLGFDTRFGHDRLTAAEISRIADKKGFYIVTAPQLTTPGAQLSSSNIRRVLTDEGDVCLATTLLGRPFSFTGTVVSGQQLGRTIGFPTANVVPDAPRQLVPANGVYAAFATVGNGSPTPAVVNIGTRPTVDDTSSKRTIEAHLIDYNNDIYAQKLTLSFIARLRPEQKFDSLESLQHAIANDTAQATAILLK